MSEAHYFLALAAGFGLGLAFFGGLWWTVRRLPCARNAVGFMMLSSLMRMALLLAGFLWIARGDPVELAVCLIGWVMARQVVIRRCGPGGAPEAKGGRSCT